MSYMKLVVGISGASGVEMGARLLAILKRMEGMETHLVISDGAKTNFHEETQMDIADVEALADYVYDDHDLGAKISSGSFCTDGMIVIPCSMKSLSNIATGNAGNLLARAADVCLKEGRKVVLVPREIPMSKIHLRNMYLAADAGCSIVPPMLTFYNDPKTLDDQVEHVIGKVLMQFGLKNEKFVPWDGTAKAPHR